MKLTLYDGTELTPIKVTGVHRVVNGTTRDCLSFIFPEDAGMDNIDAMFTEDTCKSVTIEDDEGSSFVHKNYVIRVGLSKESAKISEGDSENDATYETRITVTMAQQTYAENKLASLASESVETQLAVAELAEIVMGGE